MINQFSRVGKALDMDEDVVQVNVNFAVDSFHHNMTETPSDYLEALNSIMSSFKFTVRGHHQ